SVFLPWVTPWQSTIFSGYRHPWSVVGEQTPPQSTDPHNIAYFTHAEPTAIHVTHDMLHRTEGSPRGRHIVHSKKDTRDKLGRMDRRCFHTANLPPNRA